MVYCRGVGTPLRLLLIEDLPDDAELVLRALRLGGYDCTHLRVDTALAMSDALDREPWDLIISDYHLPGFDAPAALSLLQAHDLDIPFLLVSGTVGEAAAVTAMKAGAHDYLSKGNLKRLVPAVARELQEARNRAERRRAEQALRRSEARLRSLMEHIPNLVLVHREDAILYANPSACGALGYATSEELLAVPHGKLVLERSDPSDTPHAQRWRSKSGTEVVVLATYQPIVFDGVPATVVVASGPGEPLARLIAHIDRALAGVRARANDSAGDLSELAASLAEARQAAEQLRFTR
jgi:PAS domain S-box-containing protein